MKLTKAEYRLLDALKDVGWTWPRQYMQPSTCRVASRMRARGLISKRAWDKGYVVATALGKRSQQLKEST